ncbi:ABC transporter permease [Acidihalobacter ferrooxydans]|uniref:ABC transmembrane type-1 domain-containing protein n=1 Tax=Acidihalobacter ferrooxydans TaxID=1765967 RepID=A0A1P8UIT2_9GAMM|nr:ABC transporter permease [Acidihalobacter ferrooxydans]APZ43746.1 hypothetical protein BW247_12160 [Acidihalobacter ferrooxydans]
MRFTNVVLGSLVPVTLFLLWYFVGYFNIVPSSLVPTPGQVFEAFVNWFGLSAGHAPQMFYSGMLLSDIYSTLFRVVAGFLIATVAGVGFGIAIGMSRSVDTLFSPTFRLLGPIPPITLFPLAIVILGLGETTDVFLTAYGAFFPILAASITAVMGVHRDLLRAGRMMGHRMVGLILFVIIPAALPGISGSLRIGLGLAWMMAVTTEMLAVHSGLGYTLWNAYNYFDYPAVYAAMFMIGLCGLLTDAVVDLLTRRAIKWHSDVNARSR